MLCMMSRLTFFCTRGEAPLHVAKVASYMGKVIFPLCNQSAICLCTLAIRYTLSSSPPCAVFG